MHMFDLPPEVFAAIMEQTAHTLKLRRTLRARLVCKTFDVGLTAAIFMTASIERFYRAGNPITIRGVCLIPVKWPVPLLCKRTREREQRSAVFCVIREVVRRIMAARQCQLQEREREEEKEEGEQQCLESICTHISAWDIYSSELIAEIIKPEKPYPSEADMARACVSAAAWLGSISLVEHFIAQAGPGFDIDAESMLLASPLWAATQQGHANMMQHLFALGAKPLRCSHTRRIQRAYLPSSRYNPRPAASASIPLVEACSAGRPCSTTGIRQTQSKFSLDIDGVEWTLWEIAEGGHLAAAEFLMPHQVNNA
ncbi:uncharacterized protein K452DRAFT_297510 [Aplosporella prunicola CBS 121167]|uniref:Uncharacterized protein n=1 Tax=Aplosporella prunicola CBS 121167 TaxID=1176127 RepID=A0A6A6BHC1_9PEZI|nr:uncharacterized protein K452DRAFT_297510 [Aplosporella prunicola CBS 121167]KAF2142998.1 hypothetical protein K452DRAFT_297510 [Aplosporella prunicola CBS 121167]